MTVAERLLVGFCGVATCVFSIWGTWLLANDDPDGGAHAGGYAMLSLAGLGVIGFAAGLSFSDDDFRRHEPSAARRLLASTLAAALLAGAAPFALLGFFWIAYTGDSAAPSDPDAVLGGRAVDGQLVGLACLLLAATAAAFAFALLRRRGP